MDEHENNDEDKIEETESTNLLIKNIILKVQEELAIKYLEDTVRLIETMDEGASKQRIEERLDYIFNKEKLKKQKEIEEYEEKKKTFEKAILDFLN